MTHYGLSTLERDTLGLHLSSITPRDLRHLQEPPAPPQGDRQGFQGWSPAARKSPNCQDLFVTSGWVRSVTSGNSSADCKSLFPLSRTAGIYLGIAGQGSSGIVPDARPSPCPVDLWEM